MKQRGFHMSLEQNICVCHLLLKSSFGEKECKLLSSLITLGVGYTVVGTPERMLLFPQSPTPRLFVIKETT